MSELWRQTWTMFFMGMGGVLLFLVLLVAVLRAVSRWFMHKPPEASDIVAPSNRGKTWLIRLVIAGCVAMVAWLIAQGTAGSMGLALKDVAYSTGVATFLKSGGWKPLLMVVIGSVLLYLAVAKNYEPMLLIPIGFGAIFANTPGAGMVSHDGFLSIIFTAGIQNELLPILIFMGIGALSDFGPLLANPRLALLGGAAQLGVFGTLLGVVALNWIPGLHFDLKEACSIAIIGGADGPTSIYLSSRYAPHYMGAIMVAAYSYMAMVPLIQPPVMRLLTTHKERCIRMKMHREVGTRERIFFPVMVMILCVLLLPTAMPLLGSLAFGNFIKECGVADRLAKALQNEVMNIATILLGLGVGMQLEAVKFLAPTTLAILGLGFAAFVIGSGGGVIFAKIMNAVSPSNPVNPLIGSAGVSAFPMAARVSQRMGQESDPCNHLIFHALGANVAGQIGSIVAAGVILAILK
jgi:sodium ion-translocating decarboxylase beta subunit